MITLSSITSSTELSDCFCVLLLDYCSKVENLLVQKSTLTMHGKKHAILPYKFTKFILSFSTYPTCNNLFCHKFDKVFILLDLEIPFCFDKLNNLS